MSKELSNKIYLLEEPRTTLNNYKKISMYLPLGNSCIWKCKDCFNKHYKNMKKEDLLETTTDDIIEEYLANPFVEALIISGLEPFDNFDQIYKFIMDFREVLDHDIVIYSGYEKREVNDLLVQLYPFDNIIYKFGRYKPSLPPVFNDDLKITLASENQYTYIPK